MSIFWFILGLTLGFGFKFAADEYHHYQKNQENMLDRAEELYIKMKATEIAKEKKYDKFTTDDEKNKLNL